MRSVSMREMKSFSASKATARSLHGLPDFLSLAGSLAVPAAKRNVTWDDVIRKTRVKRADRRR